MAQKETIRFFDMFSGIGGFRAGLERAGGFSCAGHCEIDKHADRAYRAAHDIKEDEAFYEDATTIDTDTLPEFDLLCGGFPCQAFSIAGRRKGFEDKRGTLFFEISRVAQAGRPRYLLLENVPGLLSHDGGRTFTAILATLDGMGYGVEWMVLNSKDFGVPQSRKRVYIVGYLDKRCAGKIFPLAGTNRKTVVQVVGGSQGARVYDARGLACTQLANSGGRGGKTGLYLVGCSRQDGVLLIKEATKRGYKEARPGDSVDTSYAVQNQKRSRVGKGIAYTLTTNADKAVVEPDMRIRRLMPRECFRLQGFSEEQIDRFLSVDSDTQAYKQAGNAVTVNVVCAIAHRLRTVHMALIKDEVSRKELET